MLCRQKPARVNKSLVVLLQFVPHQYFVGRLLLGVQGQRRAHGHAAVLLHQGAAIMPIISLRQGGTAGKEHYQSHR